MSYAKKKSCWRGVRMAACLTTLAVSAGAGADDGSVIADRPDSILLAYGGRVVPPMESSRLPAPGAEVASRKWDRALPFFAQRVIDRGIDLPNPYSLGTSLYMGAEDRDLSDL